ncbi:unnamed protein product [Amoebophrya sp. A120]|nr:unnamed protein product [Amoebophrya sp. A120]|eukprot:GSA120T00008176001.1
MLKRQQGTASASNAKRTKVDWRAAQQDANDESDEDLGDVEVPLSSDDEAEQAKEDKKNTAGTASKDSNSAGNVKPQNGSTSAPTSTGPKINQQAGGSSPSSKVVNLTTDGPAPPAGSASNPKAVGSKESVKAAANPQDFLVESFLRFSVQFGPTIKHDFVVETKVLSRVPNKLRIVNITKKLVQLEELKDETQIEKEKQRAKLAGMDNFAGLGMTEKQVQKDQSMYVPKAEEFPALQEILGHPVSDEPPAASYLLTDGKDSLFLSVATPITELVRDHEDNPVKNSKNDPAKLSVLGRILAPSTDANLTEEEDPRAALQNLLLLNTPECCAEPFSIEVTLDVGRMQEKSAIVLHIEDQIAMVLSDFEALLAGDKIATSSGGLADGGNKLNQKPAGQEAGQRAQESGTTGRKLHRKPLFMQENKFAGQRPGFVFKTGPLGLGYYEDLVRKRIYHPEEDDDDDDDEVVDSNEDDHDGICGSRNGFHTPMEQEVPDQQTSSATSGHHVSAKANGTASATTSSTVNNSNRRSSVYYSPNTGGADEEEAADAEMKAKEKKATARYFNDPSLKEVKLDSMDAVDFFLAAREVEATLLKQQDYTQNRHDRVTTLTQQLTQLKADLRQFLEAKEGNKQANGTTTGGATTSNGTTKNTDTANLQNGGGSSANTKSSTTGNRLLKLQDDDEDKEDEDLAWEEKPKEEREAILGAITWNLERIRSMERILSKLN